MRYFLFLLISPFFFIKIFSAECECKEDEVCCQLFSREIYPNYLYIGVNCFGTDVKARLKDHFALKDSGVLGGFNVGYEYLRPSFFYAGLDLAFSSGSTSFTLDYQGESRIKVTNTTGLMFGELRLGYTMERASWLITPCIGAGFYGMISLEESTAGLGIPYGLLGLHLLYQKSDLFDVGLKADFYGEFDKRLLHHKTGEFLHLSTSTRFDCGGKLTVPFIWHVDETRRFELRLEPFITALSFSQTELLYGADFLAGYHF